MNLERQRTNLTEQDKKQDQENMEVEPSVTSKINRLFDALGSDSCLLYFKNIVMFSSDVSKLSTYTTLKANNKALAAALGKVLLNLFLSMKLVSYEESSLICGFPLSVLSKMLNFVFRGCPARTLPCSA